MIVHFPSLIWDGDSGNRDSDTGSHSSPDHRDWTQMLSEIIAMQDYTLNHDIDLGERSITFGATPEASLSYSSSIITWNLAESGANVLQIGDGTNYLQINSTGETLLVGTAKRKITLRPELDHTAQLAHAKPTQIAIGVFKGFSFPIFNNDDEELFYKVRVPYRWDGESDIFCDCTVTLVDAEDVGDKFQFRCSWEHISHDGTTVNTSNDIDTEVTVVTGKTAQYSNYHLHFAVDYNIDDSGNEIQSDELLNFRIRRIAASGSEVDNEIILLDVVVDFDIYTLAATWERE